MESEKKVRTARSFLAKFEEELDISGEDRTLPGRIPYIREKLARIASKNFVKICQDLRDAGVRYKLRYPIEINDRWKFADIYIPDINAVVLYVNDNSTYEGAYERSLRRAPFFEKKYHVLIIKDSETEMAMEMYKEFSKSIQQGNREIG